MNKIYLDNSTTTRLDLSVLEEMLLVYQKDLGVSTQIHSFGRGAKKLLEEARGRMVQALNVLEEELIFTCGGTEANNLAILGIVRNFSHKGHIITSQIEHPSVMEVCRALQSEGHAVTFVPVSKEGLIDPEDIKKAIIKKTFLISIIFAEGQTGAIQPVEEIAAIAKENGILFHTDACQVVGKLKLPIDGPHIDLLSLTAHKFHGPLGIGALFVRTGTRLRPAFFGGLEERSLRPGTIPPALATGMAKALELAEEQGSKKLDVIKQLEAQLLTGIKGIFSNAHRVGPEKQRLPGHFCVCLPGLEAEALLLNLDLEGIAIGAGRPCASGAMEPSTVLLAMGLAKEEAMSSIYLALSRFNTQQEISFTLAALSQIISRMRAIRT